MYIKKFLICLLVTLCFSSVAGRAFSAQPADSAPELRIRTEFAREGATVWAVVWLDIRQEYYAYAHQPGPSGKPTILRISATEKAANGSPFVAYPTGQERKDSFNPAITIRAYTGTVPLFVDLGQATPGEIFTGHLDLLLCSDKHCLPMQRNVTLTAPKDMPKLAMMPWAELWKRTTGVTGALPLPPPETAVREDLSTAVPTPLGAAQQLEGWTFSPRAAQEGLEVRSLGKALLLGLLAGLLLNVMPCVLPVLTLKASAMLVVGEGDRQERMRRFREHSLLFAAGILTQFFVLAILLGSAGLMWGQVFQSTAMVTGMLIVVFMLGLSMLGLFTLPMFDLKATGGASPRLSAYLTGIMATLLATPCSGPLLGGVLSWAFMQPLVIVVVVFLAVGVGMSVPYFIFAFRPQLAIYLPRPGAWMSLLERGVGFFLLGTSLYLLSILPQDRHLPLLTALLVVAVGGWIWGHFGGYSAPPLRRRILGLGLAILTLAAVHYASQPPAQEIVWEPFTATQFRASLGKQPMLVEFTADWCPNCKLLERTTLLPKNLRRWQERYGLRLIRVDLTRTDPEAMALLQALGSNSIPLTALFPKGLTASSPVVLRDMYTPAAMDQALRKTFPQIGKGI